MRKILMILLMVMFLVSSVSASQTSNFYFKTGELSNVTINCIDGDFCSAASSCAVNVLSNTEAIVSGGNMTNAGTFFYYTLTFPEDKIYSVTATCTSGSLSGNTAYTAVSNPTGTQFDNLWFNMTFFILLVAGCLWTVNQYAEKNVNGDTQIYYYLAGFFLMILGVVGFFFGLGGYSTLLTQALSLITWGLGLFFMVKPWFEGKEWNF